MQSLVGRVMCRGSECGRPWVSATCTGVGFVTDTCEMVVGFVCV